MISVRLANSTIGEGDIRRMLDEPINPPGSRRADPPPLEPLRAALQRIADTDHSCNCDDHDAPECCASVEFCCAFCIAQRALALCPDSLRADLPQEAQPKDSTGQDRLLLNEYGRKCYEAGRASSDPGLREPSRWQLIETAPKDGREMLLYGPFVPTGGTYTDIGRWSQYAGGFWDWDADDSQPTHWMPLPEPPVLALCAKERT